MNGGPPTNGAHYNRGISRGIPPMAALDDSEHYHINAKLVVYATLSGMVSFLPNGVIHGCNHHFALMCFGHSQEELLGKDITFLIPDFYSHINYIDDRSMPLPPLDEEEGAWFPSVPEHSLSPDKLHDIVRLPGCTSQLSPVSKCGTDGTSRANQLFPANKCGADGTSRADQLFPANMCGADGTSRANQLSPVNKCGADGTTRANQANTYGADGTLRVNQLSTANTYGADGTTRAHAKRAFAFSKPPPLRDATHSGLGGTTELEVPVEEKAPGGSTMSSTDVSMYSHGQGVSDKHSNSSSSDSDAATDSGGAGAEPSRLRVGPPPSPPPLCLDDGGTATPTATSQVELISPSSTSDIDAGTSTDRTPDRRDGPASIAMETVSQSPEGAGRVSSVEHLAALLESTGVEPLFSTPASSARGAFSSLAHRLSPHGAGRLGGEEGPASLEAGETSKEFDRGSVSSLCSLPEGTFLGEARHQDGSLLSIIFQLKCIPLADGKTVFCMWVSRDVDRERARNADLNMSINMDPYRTDQIVSPEMGGASGIEAAQFQQQEEALAMAGEYSRSYDTLRSIGKGAFGFVHMAHRKVDGAIVVVKFLRKSSVLKDCWVKDTQMGTVPLEICLLARLSHPNIVQLLEAYENEHYFQMVMGRHGEGLDLFEFIEKNPRLEEPLISYMFRQVVSALSYLHNINILHRDVKDENIILDQYFQLRLIDFGSAAYMEEGKLFNTFCGTLEYCSPEVLLGNSYTGPELEMWALGVTLYTLVFSENPFFEVEETISGHLQPPFFTSPGLMKVILWLLHPDPNSRARLSDLQKDNWVNQLVDISQHSFESVLGHYSSKEVDRSCISPGSHDAEVKSLS